MHTNDVKSDALKGNEEFVDYLHAHARKEKIPTTCDKSQLANFWMDWATDLMREFTELTGKGLTIQNADKFFQQAAESYEG